MYVVLCSLLVFSVWMCLLNGHYIYANQNDFFHQLWLIYAIQVSEAQYVMHD